MRTEVTSVTTRPHPISNTFHLVMTVCTGGLWAPVWWFMARGHKVTTRAPAGAGPAAPKFTGARLDPEWMAEHVPGSAEYKARHQESAEPEAGWGTQMMRDMVAGGATRRDAAKAVADEVRRQRLSG